MQLEFSKLNVGKIIITTIDNDIQHVEDSEEDMEWVPTNLTPWPRLATENCPIVARFELSDTATAAICLAALQAFGLEYQIVDRNNVRRERQKVQDV